MPKYEVVLMSTGGAAFEVHAAGCKDLKSRRLLRQANARFRLQEWNDTAQRKLAALDNVYDKLHDHAATVRAEVLEILIVLLIVFEIALSLIEH